MASWESIQEILMRHYTRQLLHEMYNVFGSTGVIGNPLGFAKSLGLGIRDFLSVPARSILQSPTGLISGMAQGTTSLVSNTVYALSDAATQFSKAAHKLLNPKMDIHSYHDSGDNSKSQLQTLLTRAGYAAPVYKTKQLKNNQFRATLEFNGMQMRLCSG